jgi:hypothetical protein
LTFKDDRYVWVVTFKPGRSFRGNPLTEVIDGGEVFVTVDLQTGNAVVTYGK